ncbi:MAG: patatin-like phospholipase family protein [Rhodomicrobium sp.]
MSLEIDREKLGQIVLVLQGGGALGAYQAGVYQALHEAQIEPDWVIGTSIGAINAGLIAGNVPGQRLAKLQEFWSRITQSSLFTAANTNPFIAAIAPNAATVAGGVPGFFEPNPAAWIGTKARLGAEQAAYYSTGPLQRTLQELTTPELLNAGSPRLTVGAANVQTGEMHYFDSRETPLSIQHIMASGALPPAFPAIRIDGELYWDGGVLSNTPVEAVFDDNPRRSGLIFAVHMWGPNGPEPDSIWSVMGRQKDLQYASRAVSHIRRQKQIHKLRHIIAELAGKLPAEVRADPEIAGLAAYGCTTQMHVVRLLAPPLAGEDHSKDIDFSAKGIRARWEAGNADTKRALDGMPWNREFDKIEGFILHEVHAGRIMEGGDIRGTLSVESS